MYLVASQDDVWVSLGDGRCNFKLFTATKGMAGMLNTVWLILCVVTFGGAMEASGMIQVITERMVNGKKYILTGRLNCCYHTVL